MSVLKKHRTTSKTQYIQTAYDIYIETLQFLTKLSAKYSRLMASHIAELAGELQAYAEKANSVYLNPRSASNEIRAKLRLTYLLKARATLTALDSSLSIVYDLLCKNPQGAFKNETIDATSARTRIDNMAASLGEKIDFENALLTGTIKATKIK